ncbi:MAG: hypothetical protein ACTSVY_14625 [Candidatus Helarchaeota archaeon]
MQDKKKKRKSSFETGIDRKLEKNYELLEWLTGEYIVSVNSKWSSNDFPSSQLAKMILKVLNKEKTNFSIFHRLVKEILKKWQKQGLCNYITTTKYAHSRKTKMIFRFDEEGIKKLKQKVMDYTIDLLEKEDELFLKIVKKQQTMKSREKIIDLILMEMEDQLLDLELDDDF